MLHNMLTMHNNNNNNLSLSISDNSLCPTKLLESPPRSPILNTRHSENISTNERTKDNDSNNSSAANISTIIETFQQTLNKNIETINRNLYEQQQQHQQQQTELAESTNCAINATAGIHNDSMRSWNSSPASSVHSSSTTTSTTGTAHTPNNLNSKRQIFSTMSPTTTRGPSTESTFQTAEYNSVDTKTISHKNQRKQQQRIESSIAATAAAAAGLDNQLSQPSSPLGIQSGSVSASVDCFSDRDDDNDNDVDDDEVDDDGEESSRAFDFSYRYNDDSNMSGSEDRYSENGGVTYDLINDVSYDSTKLSKKTLENYRDKPSLVRVTFNY